MFKIAAIVLLILIIASLFSALLALARGQGRGERVVRALTVRIALSLLLFSVLVGGYYLGFIKPS